MGTRDDYSAPVKQALCAALLVLIGGIAEAARVPEGPDGAPGDGSIRAMKRLNSAEGWVLTDHELLVTGDGGATWSDVTPPRRLDGLTTAFFLDARRGWLTGVDSSSRARLLALDTSDAGGSWRELVVEASALGEGSSYASADVQFTDADHGWLLGRRATSAAFSVGELLRTVDGGLTWERVPRPPAAGRFVFVDAHRGFMLGPGEDRLYATEDGALSWKRLRLPAATQGESALYDLPTFDGSNDGVIAVTVHGAKPRVATFVTSDGGRTWRPDAALSLRDQPVDERVVPVILGGRLEVLGGTGTVTLAPLSTARSLALREELSTPSVRALSFADETHGWALLAEGACQAGECRQLTRLVSLDADGSGEEPGATLLTRQWSTSQEQTTLAGAVIGSGKAFDKCAVGTTAQMQTWFANSPFRGANIYYGGISRGCDYQPSLTPTWVQTVFAQGWRLIPTWVGPQAPCATFKNRFSYDTTVARSQGLTDATSAVNAAAALGLTAGAPLYYDLESYNAGNASCAAAVRAFINAWVERVKASGYVAGVYGTASNTARDWIPGVIANPPDAVWLASWACGSGSQTCSFTPTVWNVAPLSNSYWPDHQRLRQYWGSHNETYGGVTFTIDSNAVDGPLAAPDGCHASVTSDRWRGEYFANRTLSGTPVMVRDDGNASLDFDWGAGSPGSSCGLGTDDFSARWTRTLSFASGTHRFTLTSDDGVRLYVDGALKLDKWVDQAPTTYSVDVALAAGNHTLRMEYYENVGSALAKLSWQLLVPVEVIVDDLSSGFARFGPSAYWWQASIGYLSHMYWTYVNGTAVSNYARWTPNLASGGPGSYAVYVFIPRNYATAQQAKYRVRHNGRDDYSAPVNQALYFDQWVSIGSYSFSAAGGEYVELTDATGEAYSTGRRLGFDAVKFVK